MDVDTHVEAEGTLKVFFSPFCKGELKIKKCKSDSIRFYGYDKNLRLNLSLLVAFNGIILFDIIGGKTINLTFLYDLYPLLTPSASVALTVPTIPQTG